MKMNYLKNMGTIALRILLTGLVLMVILPFAKRAEAAEVVVDVNYCQTEARKMLDRINDFRTGDECWYWNEDNTEKVWVSGLGELTYDYELEKAAKIRAAELVVRFAHERPDGRGPETSLDEVGYYWIIGYGENIEIGPGTEEDAFNIWKEDWYWYEGQGHRRNMLAPQFNAIGIACVEVDGEYYWVQEFAGNTPDSEQTPSDDSSKEIVFSIDDEDITDLVLNPGSAAVIGIEKNEGEMEAMLVDIGSTVSISETELYISLSFSDRLLRIRNEQASVISDSDCFDLSGDVIKGIKAGQGNLIYSAFGYTKPIKVFVRKPGDPDPRISPEDDKIKSSSKGSYKENGHTVRTATLWYQSGKITIEVLYDDGEQGDSSPFDIFSKPFSMESEIETTGNVIYDSLYLVMGDDEVKLTELYEEDGKVSIPQEVELYKVTAIGSNVITKGEITSIEIGKNVSVIESEAFKDQKKLKSIMINAGSLKTVGKDAFKNIYKKAVITLVGTKSQVKKAKKLLKASGLGKKVKFKRVAKYIDSSTTFHYK